MASASLVRRRRFHVVQGAPDWQVRGDAEEKLASVLCDVNRKSKKSPLGRGPWGCRALSNILRHSGETDCSMMGHFMAAEGTVSHSFMIGLLLGSNMMNEIEARHLLKCWVNNYPLNQVIRTVRGALKTLFSLPHTTPMGSFRLMTDQDCHAKEVCYCRQLVGACAVELSRMPFCKVESNQPLLEAPKQVQLQYIQDKYFILCKPSTGKSSPHQLQAATFFSGIAVMDLALKEKEVRLVANVEIDGLARKVLDIHFPEVPVRWDNVKTMPVLEYKMDFVSVTFPCDGTSQAGTRVGIESGVRFEAPML